MRRRVIGLVACACLLQAHVATAQGLTGALIGSVRDAQGEVVSGAVVRLSSPALIGGAQTLTTNETGGGGTAATTVSRGALCSVHSVPWSRSRPGADGSAHRHRQG